MQYFGLYNYSDEEKAGDGRPKVRIDVDDGIDVSSSPWYNFRRTFGLKGPKVVRKAFLLKTHFADTLHIDIA